MSKNTKVENVENVEAAPVVKKLSKPRVKRDADTYRVVNAKTGKAVESGFATRGDARKLRNYHNALGNNTNHVISRGEAHRMGATVGKDLQVRNTEWI